MSPWPYASVGQLEHFLTSGSRGWAGFYAESGPAFLRITNLRRNSVQLDLTDLKRVDIPKESSEGVRTKVSPEDLLISITAEPGLIGYVPPSYSDESYVSQHVALLRLSDPRVCNAFVAFFLTSFESQAKFREVSDSGAKAGLNLSTIRSLAVPVPPLPEQRKIADILSTWDEALEKLDALIAAKERHKQALMQQLLTGRKRVKGFTRPWRSVQIGELLKSADRYKKWDDTAIVRLAGVRRNGKGLFFRAELPASEIKVKTAKIIHEADFLISRRQITYGGMAVVPREFHGFEVNDEYEVLVPLNPETLDIRFFGHLARTRRLMHLAYLASNGFLAERLRLNFELPTFLESLMKVPTDAHEQGQIATILDTADQELTLLRRQRDTLEKQKRGLMQRLLTGKLRVAIP